MLSRSIPVSIMSLDSFPKRNVSSWPRILFTISNWPELFSPFFLLAQAFTDLKKQKCYHFLLSSALFLVLYIVAIFSSFFCVQVKCDENLI